MSPTRRTALKILLVMIHINRTKSRVNSISCFTCDARSPYQSKRCTYTLKNYPQNIVGGLLKNNRKVSYLKADDTIFEESEVKIDKDESINTEEQSLGAYLMRKSKEVQEELEKQGQFLQENLINDEMKEYASSNIDDRKIKELSMPQIEAGKLDNDLIIDEAQLLQLESSITTYPNAETALKETKIITSKSSIVIPHRATAIPPETCGPTPSESNERDKMDKRKRSRMPLRKRIFNSSVREKIAEKIMQEKVIETDFPIKDPELYNERISRDIRHLAVRIASTIESPEQLTQFCQENGGFKPLFECIHEGALLFNGNSYDLADYTRVPSKEILTKEKLEKEEIFSAASSACKALRDLSNLSQDVASVLTDSALQMNITKENKGEITLIDDLVSLLRYVNKYEKASQRLSSIVRLDKNSGLKNVLQRLILGKERRRRCRLHILQLLLAMAVASDEAILRLQSTPGLREAIISCSSYANLKEQKKTSSRFPINILNRFSPSNSLGEGNNNGKTIIMTKLKKERKRRDFNSKGNAINELESTANKLLAAIGHNIWVPKSEGQKGLRILCLDGGGTRGITALGTLKAIVEALDGAEPCDSFDIIAGTSTGGIIAFLLGLKLDSAAQAKQRYDTLIKRIFVKSALATPMLVFTTASYDEAYFTSVMKECLGELSMLDSRSDLNVPLVFAVSSKMSTTPTQLSLFRNYNYKSGEIPDNFVVNPVVARTNLDLPVDNIDAAKVHLENSTFHHFSMDNSREIMGEGSRHSGSFRVKQRIALRASTAAPTFFKPLLVSGELYCDGGMGASNPTAVAIHEARSLFPDVPIELVVSLGTGAFEVEKNSPKIGWDGILGSILDSALDAETTHHTLEDILGQGGTAQLGKSSVSQTRYYRFNPIIGKPNAFGIDETDPQKLEELTQIATNYMQEDEQARKLKEIKEIVNPSVKKRWWENKRFKKE